MEQLKQQLRAAQNRYKENEPLSALHFPHWRPGRPVCDAAG